jgi:thymidylate synthase (FAD)
MKVNLFRCDGIEDDIIEMAMITKGLKISKLKTPKTIFITHLLENNHLTPFEFVRFIFQIQCSRACHSQFLQYRTASRLTRSLRHVEPLEIQNPELINEIPEGYRRTYAKQALKEYQFQVSRGVERQEARGILPLDISTEFYWYIDLRNLLHFLEERLDKPAQNEINSVAKSLIDIASERFPATFESWKQLKKQKGEVITAYENSTKSKEIG